MFLTTEVRTQNKTIIRDVFTDTKNQRNEQQCLTIKCKDTDDGSDVYFLSDINICYDLENDGYIQRRTTRNNADEKTRLFRGDYQQNTLFYKMRYFKITKDFT